MKLPALLVLSSLASGCATTAVTDSVEAVPDWFAQRSEELAGEGYPTFDQAQVLDEDVEETPWRKVEAKLTREEKRMEREAPGPVDVTEEEMRAWVAKHQALVAKGEEPY